MSNGFAYGLVPEVVRYVKLAILGYATYAYCYVYSWQLLARPLAITFIAIYSTCMLLVIIYWLAIVLHGPGKVEQVKPSPCETGPTDPASDMPKVFPCDVHGYPLWCHQCKTIKLLRVHHSSQAKRCVPTMDHYCVWVGTVIAEHNMKAFMLYALAMNVYLWFTFFSLFVHLRKNGFLISLFVLSGFWGIFVLTLVGQHLMLIFQGKSLLERLQRKTKNLPIYNFEHSNGSRVVSRLHESDPSPFMGGWPYLKLILGDNPLLWLIPNGLSQVNWEFSEDLRDVLEKRFDSGEEGYLAFRNC